MFLCFGGALFREPQGTLFIDGFRSRRIQRDEDQRHRRNKGGMGRPHVARESGRVGHACLALVAPLLHLLRS
jgi:hypothetical protein